MTPLTLADAAASGERLTALRVLRDRLARDLDACASARDVASLSQRLMEGRRLLSWGRTLEELGRRA